MYTEPTYPPRHPNICVILSPDDSQERIVNEVNYILTARGIPLGEREEFLELASGPTAQDAMLAARMFVTVEFPSGR